MTGRRPGGHVVSSNDDSEVVALVEGIDELEGRMAGLHLTRLRITARVATYFGVLAAVTVGVVDTAYLVPWVGATFVAACIPEFMRYLRYRALVRERDELIEGGVVRRGGGGTSKGV